MTKYEFIERAFIANGIPLTNYRGNIDYVLLTCEGSHAVGCSSCEVTKFNKMYLPNKPKYISGSVYILY